MKFLCTYINTVEWSGCTFYSIEGDLTKPDELSILVHDMIPLDKGSAAFTEYNFDGRVMKYMNEMDYFDLKIGHLHSHHNMKTFFSGTDLDEVMENSEFIKPYLSIIINNAYDFSCKLAFRIKEKTPTTYEFQDIDYTAKQFSIPSESEYVANYDCTVVIPMQEFSISDSFKHQFNEIMKPKPVVKQLPKYPPVKLKNDSQGALGLFDDEFLEWKNNSPKSLVEPEPPLVEFEAFYCYLLRLGNAVENDTLEIACEDLQNSVLDFKFSLEEYARSLKTNFKKFFMDFWNVKKLVKNEAEQEWEEFTDELMFAADEFPVLDNLLELLHSYE